MTIELPCSPGETVYIAALRTNIVYKATISEISFRTDGVWLIDDRNGMWNLCDEWSIHATREEAERSLSHAK